MFSNRTILYWFREPIWNPQSYYGHLSLEKCSGFIPVYCFDSREKHFFSDNEVYNSYLNEEIERVAQLRLKLQQKGSNLLIVNGSYEVLIPSLSRVLQATEVISNANLVSESANLGQLADFRTKKMTEIQHNLNMHSISMKFEQYSRSIQFPEDFSFLPPFPEINPGNVPVLSYFED